MKTVINETKSQETPVERRCHDRRSKESPGYARVAAIGWYCRRYRNRRKDGAEQRILDT